MGLLDKFKKKNQPQFNQYGPKPFNSYQQPYPSMHHPYGMRPQFQHYTHQQGYFPPQQPVPQNHGYYQQPVAQQQYTGQPQLNAYQNFVNQNKLLQPVPFQNEPVIQSHNSSSIQQQSGSQSQYPMTGQPPDRQDGQSTGFLSRILGGDTSIAGILGNMQRAVQTAQQVTPMIQQYGPIVKNLPSLYKIFKEVNTDDLKEVKKSDKKEKNVQTKTVERKRRKKDKTPIENGMLPIPEKNEINSSPKPKLFV